MRTHFHRVHLLAVTARLRAGGTWRLLAPDLSGPDDDRSLWTGSFARTYPCSTGDADEVAATDRKASSSCRLQ
jgi:hypothetical protein